MGKLIVFEGIDGSGKSTQCSLLCSRLEKEGISFRRLTFPRYSEQSSALIRMYLNGDFGDKPGDVNPYAASTFFAVDRFASYAQDWRDYYNNGGLIITDRYTTSNAIHQGSKLSPDEQNAYFKWLVDFEFGLMQLPAPDMVLYHKIPVDLAIEHMRTREAATGTSADIHEKDNAYLRACAECADRAAELFSWRTVLSVAEDGRRRPADEIHEEIYAMISAMAEV